MDSGIGVDEDPLGRQPLRAVAGDGVAVVEMPVNSGVEFDLTAIVEPGGNPAIRPD